MSLGGLLAICRSMGNDAEEPANVVEDSASVPRRRPAAARMDGPCGSVPKCVASMSCFSLAHAHEASVISVRPPRDNFLVQ